MPHDLRNLAPDLQAAHVGLLMLRAAVRATARTPHAFQLAPGAEIRHAGLVAQMLVALPKPIALDGTCRRRYVQLTAEPAAESCADLVRLELRLREWCPDRPAELRDFLQPRSAESAEHLPVAVRGCGFRLI